MWRFYEPLLARAGFSAWVEPHTARAVGPGGPYENVSYLVMTDLRCSFAERRALFESMDRNLKAEERAVAERQERIAERREKVSEVVRRTLRVVRFVVAGVIGLVVFSVVDAYLGIPWDAFAQPIARLAVAVFLIAMVIAALTDN